MFSEAENKAGFSAVGQKELEAVNGGIIGGVPSPGVGAPVLLPIERPILNGSLKAALDRNHTIAFGCEYHGCGSSDGWPSVMPTPKQNVNLLGGSNFSSRPLF